MYDPHIDRIRLRKADPLLTKMIFWALLSAGTVASLALPIVLIWAVIKIVLRYT